MARLKDMAEVTASTDPQTTTLVSVVIPVYNDTQGITACLDALRRQTCGAAHFEVVVVDNGSTPPLALGESYPFKTHIARCPMPGAYAARNAGARIAAGEILAFTDADCIPRPDWIERGTAALLCSPEGRFVGGDVCFTPPTSRTGVALYQYATGFRQRSNIEIKGFTATANLFCRRSDFRRVGAFNENLLSGGDREWCWRARDAGLLLAHANDAVVLTAPRESLISAIQQARRVAAGRLHLRRIQHNRNGDDHIDPHKGSFTALVEILSNAGLTLSERLRIFSAAIILKGAVIFELMRLRLGGRPERR